MHPIEQLRFVARASGADARLLVEEAASALTVFGHDHRALVMACRRLVERQPSIAPLWWLCSRLVTAGDASSEARSVVRELGNDPAASLLARHLVGVVPDTVDPAGLDDADREPTVRIVIAGWPDTVLAGIVEAAAGTRSMHPSVAVVDVDGQGPAVARHLVRADVPAEHVDPARLTATAETADVVVVEAAATNGRWVALEPGSLALMTAAADHTPVWCVVPAGRSLPDMYWRPVTEPAGTDVATWTPALDVASLALVDAVVSDPAVVTRDSSPSADDEQWLAVVSTALKPRWPTASELLP